MSKKFIGYTGPFPKPTGNEFDGLKKALNRMKNFMLRKEEV